jgi:ABC-type maltose transport system permease subunit
MKCFKKTFRLKNVTFFQHFTNTLVFAVLASIIFMLWSIKYHKVGPT